MASGIAYNVLGERVQVTTTSRALEWTGWRATTPGSGMEVYADDPGLYEWDGYHWTESGKAIFSGKVVESYTYTLDGQLDQVSLVSEQASADGSNVVTANGTMGSSVLRADYDYDSQGRLLSQTDYAPNGSTVAYSRTGIVYDTANRIASERQVTRRGTEDFYSDITSNYAAGTGSYALGAVTSVATSDWKTLGGTTTDLPDTLTTNNYAWRSGAVLSSSVWKPDSSVSTSYTTAYSLTPAGAVTATSISGSPSRSVDILLDALGQALRRVETDSASRRFSAQTFLA